MITGDQAVALLGFLGQTLINSTQQQMRMQQAATEITQLREHVAELEAQLADDDNEDGDDEPDGPEAG